MAETLREVAYRRFKEKLFEQKITPGAFISQRELSELLGMPLGPTREALKKLEAENLVQLIAQRGIQVCPIDYLMIQETFELRLILEIAGLERFIDVASDEEIDALIRRTEEAAEAIEISTPSIAALADVRLVDREMHNAFIAVRGNSIISEIYERNFAKIRLIRLNGKHLPERSKEILQEHLAVLQAARKRDFPAAKAALTRHLVISHQRALGLESPKA